MKPETPSVRESDSLGAGEPKRTITPHTAAAHRTNRSSPLDLNLGLISLQIFLLLSPSQPLAGNSDFLPLCMNWQEEIGRMAAKRDWNRPVRIAGLSHFVFCQHDLSPREVSCEFG